MFASDELLQMLLHSDVLLTFKVAPKLFEQLYVTHGLTKEESIYIFRFAFLESYLPIYIQERRIKEHYKFIDKANHTSC